MDHSQSFWDRAADRYAKRPVADPDAYQWKLKRTQEYFTPDSTVLEFGCGTGTTALLHAPHVKSILATDISEQMIELCNQKLADSDCSNVEFRQTTLSDLPHEPHSFDVIMGHSILHLLRDLEGTLAKVYELLKPGGVFVSSTVCLREKWYSWPMKPVLTAGRWLGFFPYVTFMKMATLEQKVREAGFHIVESSSPGNNKMVCFLIVRKP